MPTSRSSRPAASPLAADPTPLEILEKEGWWNSYGLCEYQYRLALWYARGEIDQADYNTRLRAIGHHLRTIKMHLRGNGVMGGPGITLTPTPPSA